MNLRPALISNAKPRILYIVGRIVQRIGLDRETCIQILDEGGFLRKRGYMSIDLGLIPDGLSAEETKRFLLEKGAKICPAGPLRVLEHQVRNAIVAFCPNSLLSKPATALKVKNVEAGETFHIRLNTG